MQFNYDIKATKKQVDTIGFLFEPETIKIEVGNKNDAGDLVSITTTLRQTIDGGYIQQVREQWLPVSILAAIDGFDVNTMQPAINPAALTQILAGFNLALTT